jgi:N-methylhydantoinase A/oxoprolinase/acetone carboxylase beta subunit
MLGWLNPEFFVGGKFRLDAAAAARAISTHIAEPLKLSAIEAANGIIKIVSSNMVEALRLVTVSRGEDPREYVLVGFGGAGPVHAALLAQELKIPRVLVPAAPGVHSAIGLLVSDLKRDYVQTHFAELEEVEGGTQRFDRCSGGATRVRVLRHCANRLSTNAPSTCATFRNELPVPWRVPVEAGQGGMAKGVRRNTRNISARAEDQKVEVSQYRLTTSDRIEAGETNRRAAGKM